MQTLIDDFISAQRTDFLRWSWSKRADAFFAEGDVVNPDHKTGSGSLIIIPAE
jgi:hypothetical protein